MKDLLRAYADLVVRVGVNLQKDQILVINAPIECAAFARMIAQQAFAAGAHDVVVSWSDEQLAHIRYAGGKKALFTEFPNGGARSTRITRRRARRSSRLRRAIPRSSATSTRRSSNWPIRRPVRRSWSTAGAS